MARIFLILLFLQCIAFAKAQKIASIPFEELLGGVILLNGTVGNSKDTLNFILDTGNSHISLDSTTAAAIGLTTVATDRLVRGIGGAKKIKRTTPLSLHLKGLSLDSLEFNVNDYRLITESYGLRIDGVIGFEFLYRYLINVNFETGFLHLYKRGTPYKKRASGYLWNFQISYIPKADVLVKDANAYTPPLYIDCGAGLALLLSEKMIADSAVLSKKKKPVETQIEGVVGVARTRLTTVKELRIGPYKFKRVPTYLYDDVDGILNYPAQMGLVGNEILRRFNWWLDYGRSQIYLIPNSNFKDPFDVTYTGLSTFLVNGLVTVTDVVKNSPGHKAGFQNKDIILSIDDYLITTVKQAKNQFQNTRRKVKVVVIRNTKAITLFIKPEFIY